MSKRKFLRLFVGSLCLFAISIYGCQSIPESNTKSKDNDTEKEFAEVIKNCKPIEGLFTIYHNEKDGKAFLEILPDRFDKIFLCTVTRESGDSTFFDSLSLENNFPFFLKKVNKRVHFILKNILFRADKDKPVFRAIEKGVSDSITASAPILSKPHRQTGAVLVPLNDLFIIDRQNTAHHLNEGGKTDYSLDKDNSYFSVLKSFPDNTDIEVALHFRSSKPVSSPTSPDPRSLTLRYYYSLSRLPESNYIPRLADDRVGHFITMYQDYSSVKPETSYVRYIERWHLEKSDLPAEVGTQAGPDAPLSSPKKPIVFWLEKTIPLEYRDSIKKGVLLWNKAFEKIGFKDAIVVYQQPDDADWDPADVRYNTIRWMVNPGSGYAVGPSNADPFTGELYNADIRISADMMRFSYTKFEESVNPLRDSCSGQGFCNYATGLAQQAAFGWSLLQSRGFLEGKEEDAEKFVQDYLVQLTTHEVGHTLGLRHNFKASSIRSIDQLNDKNLTSDKGLTGSVMDYNPVNLSLAPAQQGEYWHSALGPYDYWVIEYAYKPLNVKTPDEELAQLEEIASKSVSPELVYGTDEDAVGNSVRGIDPTCSLFDIGNDSLEYARIRITLVSELWNKIEQKFSKPGERYQKMRLVFLQGLREYTNTAILITRYIGGIYHCRTHIGSGDTAPLKPVEAAKQKKALEFIINNIFALSEETIPPSDVLNKLAPEMMPDFADTVGKAASIEIQVHNSVLSIQKPVLDYLYNPFVLTRLSDMSVRSEKTQEKFGLAELFNGIKDGIYSELYKGKNINSFRRNLQREYTEKLITLFRNPPAHTPSDAISLSHSNLVSIWSNINTVLTDVTKLDVYTRAHLEDINSRIIAALEWKQK